VTFPYLCVLNFNVQVAKGPKSRGKASLAPTQLLVEVMRRLIMRIWYQIYLPKGLGISGTASCGKKSDEPRSKKPRRVGHHRSVLDGGN
jgi:hypothetical protein